MSGGIIKVSRNTELAPINPLSTQSVAFSHYNNISAQLPIDPKTGHIVAGDIKQQAKQCLENIKAIVESIDHVMDDVVKIHVFVKNIDDLALIDEVYATFFPNLLPVRTVVAVNALPLGDALVQMDTLISNGEGTAPQEPCPLIKLSRNTDKAPVSALSTQTVAFSHYNNISAQLPLNPATGELVAGGIKEQTSQCLQNIKAVMESIDVPFDDIVKVGIYLKDLGDLPAVNEVYSTFFPDSAIARTVAYVPARTVAAVKDLPKQALVQIDVVVSHGDGTPPQEVEDRHGIVIRANNTEAAPLNPLHTQTVAFSHYNHIAAQLPLDPQSNQMVSGGVAEQAEQCLTNIKAIVESVNHVMDDIVKVNIQLKDIADLDAVNEVYTRFFNGELPARTVVGVSVIEQDALVQIDAVVSNGEGTPPQH
ncbi:Rid family hydrolase [Vibrio brasiliensis]|uniref:Endoribonuclease L-PSP domain n=1 Tax=Vibrio brasiliensis LMG 20546 TaxID=945543 RepID=E8LU07_9VIBR|nr:Rid family hydrolase [Vibrio brasiliensis]EGA65843.1 endoribonuclease L-PSP domain [Vibrio brasiliensis LMG 20546]